MIFLVYTICLAAILFEYVLQFFRTAFQSVLTDRTILSLFLSDRKAA